LTFMLSLEQTAYIPDIIWGGVFTPDPYILSREELKDLMTQVDDFILFFAALYA